MARRFARGAVSYVRLRVEVHRTDKASAEAVVRMFDALHKRLLRRWWRRLVLGQPAVALEVHHGAGPRQDGAAAELGVDGAACPRGHERMVQAALRTAYPNCSTVGAATSRSRRRRRLLRLKKDRSSSGA